MFLHCSKQTNTLIEQQLYYRHSTKYYQIKRRPPNTDKIHYSSAVVSWGFTQAYCLSLSVSEYALGDERKWEMWKKKIVNNAWLRVFGGWKRKSLWASGYSVLLGTIPIMSSRHCDRALQFISYAVIQLTTSLPPAAPPAFDKNRGKLKSWTWIINTMTR